VLYLKYIPPLWWLHDLICQHFSHLSELVLLLLVSVHWGGPFPKAKVRSGRDADHSPPSSAEVENE
jgi:hypothetical protein